MLVPALLYKDEIERRSRELCYSDASFYYGDGLGQSYISVEENDDYGELFQYAIVDRDKKLVGFLRYRIHWYNSCAHCFGLINLSGAENSIIGIDVYREIKKIIYEYKIHRIEFRMIKGNPVERHYQKLIEKYNGRAIVLRDAIKDRKGVYHDDVTYEIITSDLRKEALCPTDIQQRSIS